MDFPRRRAGDAAGGDGRETLVFDARLRRAGDPRTIAVQVRNLSAGGLMAEIGEPVDPNAAIEIEVRGIGWIAGRIAWHTEGRTGIAFDHPIDPRLARAPG